MTRSHNRDASQIRPAKITRHYTKHAEGSVLIECGNTKVICTASISEKIPPFLKDKNQGWLTAEYGMLPGSTHERMQRDAARGKQSGRTMEIQRLIGRPLRAVIDLNKLGERTIQIDCDVIQADGGTRTASITGAFVALADAIDFMNLPKNPIKHHVASVSVGLYKSVPVLDLDYAEDANAETDMNVVMNSNGGFIEIQGTAERADFSASELQALLGLAETGINTLVQKQKDALASS